MNSSTHPSTATTPSVVSQTQSDTHTPTNESNYDSFVIRRVHFSTLPNIHHPNDNIHATLLDHMDRLVSNLPTSHIVNQLNFPSTFGFKNETTNPSIAEIFPVLVNENEAPSPVDDAITSVDKAPSCMLREPPPLVLFDNITSARKIVIQKVSSLILSVPSPRPFQVGCSSLSL